MLPCVTCTIYTVRSSSNFRTGCWHCPLVPWRKQLTHPSQNGPFYYIHVNGVKTVTNILFSVNWNSWMHLILFYSESKLCHLRCGAYKRFSHVHVQVHAQNRLTEFKLSYWRYHLVRNCSINIHSLFYFVCTIYWSRWTCRLQCVCLPHLWLGCLKEHSALSDIRSTLWWWYLKSLLHWAYMSLST